MIAQSEQLLLRGFGTTSSLLPAVFNVFRHWCLTDVQQMTLSGLSDGNILNDWKNQPVNAELTLDDLERASYILGIYRSLQILFPDPSLADQ